MVKYSDDTLDAVFSALADRRRRALLAQLAEGEHAVGSLASPHGDISLPGLTKHLRVLESAGLLEREKTGRVVRCRLQPEPLREADEWLERYRIFWRDQLDSLARFLDQDDAPTDPEKPSCPPSSTPQKPRSGSSANTRIRAKKSSAPGPTRRR